MTETTAKTFESPDSVQKNTFFAANWIKTVFFAVLALILTAANFFVESGFAEDVVEDVAVFSAFDYEKENVISGNGLVRFDKSGDFSNPKMTVGDRDDGYIFELGSGRFWANFSLTNEKINILAGQLVLIPEGAVFDLSFDGSRLELNVHDGDVYVGFVPAGVKIGEYVDAYSALFMNRLLVPRGNQLIVPMKKVTEKIRPLLYSKLIKEFKFASLPAALQDSAFVKENMEKDSKFIENLKQQYLADVLYGGTRVKKGFVSDFLFWAEENLTFVPDRVRNIGLDHLFVYLDDAIFYADQGDSSAAEASLQAYETYYSSLNPVLAGSEEFHEKLDAYIGRLAIFDPDEKEYKILTALLSDKFSSGRDRYGVVAQFWRHVYRGFNISQALAEETLNNYYEFFDKTMIKGTVPDEDFYKMYLIYQNQLFDNLLMKSPLFYKDGYFAIKELLEKDLLSLYKTGQMREELQQALISSKIDFLKRLKKFFFDEELEVKQTREIFKRLFGEIDALMSKDEAGLAVVELFEQQLNDMDDFWGYLNSPEYHTKSYGATHEDRFRIYLQERETIWNFINIKEDVLGEPSGVSDEITIVDVVDEIKKTLEGNGDVSKVEIGKIGQVDQRYVAVKMVLGGYPVDALFDRDSGSLKEVKVYEELISERSVRVQSLLVILQTKFADLADEETGKEEEDKKKIETAAQRFARTYISKKINGFGFKSTLENIKIVDQLNAIYRVENVTFRELQEVKVTFDVLMSGELATSVLVNVKGKPRVLDGKYSFEELATMVQAEYDFSVGKESGTGSGENSSNSGDGSSTDDDPAGDENLLPEASDGLPTGAVPR